MNTKNFVFDKGTQSEVVEDISAISPDTGGTVLSPALVVEAIDLSDLTGLVVASDQGHSIWVSHF